MFGYERKSRLPSELGWVKRRRGWRLEFDELGWLALVFEQRRTVLLLCIVAALRFSWDSVEKAKEGESTGDRYRPEHFSVRCKDKCSKS